MRFNRSLLRVLMTLVGTLSLTAFAHGASDFGGHDAIGFVDGLLHPMTGPDHLAAMLAVGCWSALTARRTWTAPLAFAVMLLLGAQAGRQGLFLPAAEPAIVASLLVLGLLVATRRTLPAMSAASLVGAFAVFHGVAHGNELAAAAAPWAPLAGMAIGTLLLHLIGIALGRALKHSGGGASRVAGGAVLLLGLTLLLKGVHA